MDGVRSKFRGVHCWQGKGRDRRKSIGYMAALALTWRLPCLGYFPSLAHAHPTSRPLPSRNVASAEINQLDDIARVLITYAYPCLKKPEV
jgi:hypothetical protein